ncbi:MAG: type pantothenate kinase [Actinomycetia bacterium]|nr:type pantothenate kinase [Actinomycetes bacterium]
MEADERAFLAALAPLARALNTCATSRGSRPAPYVVAVGGGVAVGKSTVARVLGEFAAAGPGRPEVAIVSLDSFLLRNTELDAAGLSLRKGFPESYDADGILRFMAAVRAGERGLRVPVYSHERYDIVPGASTELPAADLLVVEGLHALAPLVDGSTLADLGVYVDAPPDAVFSWYLARFRKLLLEARDDPDSFFHAWSDLSGADADGLATGAWQHINVVNLAQHIQPTRAAADVVIEKDASHRVRLIDQTGRLAEGAARLSPGGSG